MWHTCQFSKLDNTATSEENQPRKGPPPNQSEPFFNRNI